MIKNGGFPLNIYSLLYNSCVTSVADYSAPVTGYEEVASATKIHLRALRAYLGVTKNATNAGVLSVIKWLLSQKSNLNIIFFSTAKHTVKKERSGTTL